MLRIKRQISRLCIFHLRLCPLPALCTREPSSISTQRATSAAELLAFVRTLFEATVNLCPCHSRGKQRVQWRRELTVLAHRAISCSRSIHFSRFLFLGALLLHSTFFSSASRLLFFFFSPISVLPSAASPPLLVCRAGISDKTECAKGTSQERDALATFANPGAPLAFASFLFGALVSLTRLVAVRQRSAHTNGSLCAFLQTSNRWRGRESGILI